MPTLAPNNNAPSPLLVSARELAAMLSVSVATVRRLDAAGKLPRPVRLGGTVRWRMSDIAEWAAAGCPRERHL